MKSKMITGGFTIVELAVVISIIGMLSSILLVGLKGARTKAQTARIISETIQLRNQLEEGFNGSSYTDFTQYAPSDMPNESVAPNAFSGTPGAANINTLISDITSLNGGSYGGGTASSDNSCSGQSVSTYNVSNTSNVSTAPGLNNGITIFVSPACGPVTSYAIFVSLAPVQVSLSYNPFVETAYAGAQAPTNPNNFTGFYCIDSLGHAEVVTNSFIPGYTSTNPYPAPYTVNGITGPNVKCP